MKYKKILLKLSGESLIGQQKYGIDSLMISSFASEISQRTSQATGRCRSRAEAAGDRGSEIPSPPCPDA